MNPRQRRMETWWLKSFPVRKNVIVVGTKEKKVLVVFSRHQLFDESDLFIPEHI